MHVRTYPLLVLALAGCFAESPKDSVASASSGGSESSSTDAEGTTGGRMDAWEACVSVFQVASTRECCNACDCGLACEGFEDQTCSMPESVPTSCGCWDVDRVGLACDEIVGGAETASEAIVLECIAGQFESPAILNAVCAVASGTGEPGYSPACDALAFFDRCAAEEDCYRLFCE